MTTPSNPLAGIPLTALDRLAAALASGTFDQGISEITLNREVRGLPAEAAGRLASLSAEGWTTAQVRQMVEATRSAYQSGLRESHLFDLVMSGPEHPAIPMRDTHAVFRELISEATTEILVASYAIYNGHEILEPLAQRMDGFPDLAVSMFLNVPRGRDDRSLPIQCVARFRKELTGKHWPGQRLPSLYYFKASAVADWRERASMHAKLVIADRRRVFLSSANLTRAAQTKNIEVGTLIESEAVASRLTNYFRGLAESGEFIAF